MSVVFWLQSESFRYHGVTFMGEALQSCCSLASSSQETDFSCFHCSITQKSLNHFQQLWQQLCSGLDIIIIIRFVKMVKFSLLRFFFNDLNERSIQWQDFVTAGEKAVNFHLPPCQKPSKRLIPHCAVGYINFWILNYIGQHMQVSSAKWTNVMFL